MACVAGVMYLIQERFLKRHQLNSFFHNLPPIALLATAMQRVMAVGVGLLALGLLAGFMSGNVQQHLGAITWAFGVWLTYTGVLVARWSHRFSARRIAWMSVVAFTVALTTLGVLSFTHL